MRDQVKELCDRGYGTNAIARELGVSAAAVVYHKRKLGYAIQKQGKAIDWERGRVLLSEGASHRTIVKELRISNQTLHRAFAKGTLQRPNYYISIHDIAEVYKNRRCKGPMIKSKLITELGWEDKCQRCNLSEWLEEPLTIQVDHINGDPTNHRIDNLRLLCPNCHSQTDTWGNKKRIIDAG